MLCLCFTEFYRTILLDLFGSMQMLSYGPVRQVTGRGNSHRMRESRQAYNIHVEAELLQERQMSSA